MVYDATQAIHHYLGYMSYLIFDGETRPLPAERIKELGLMPRFKPGNTKDPEKLKVAEVEHDEKCLDKAGLDSLMATVCAIGVRKNAELYDSVSTEQLLFGDEAVILDAFWRLVIDEFENSTGDVKFISFNGNRFDLPFFFRRSWALGITPPAFLRNGRYWDRQCVDLLELWKLGNHDDYASLDRIARSFGLEGKSGTGKDFWKLIDTDRPTAEKYLSTDLLLTEQIAWRMGVV